jgi:hypothetical protein
VTLGRTARNEAAAPEHGEAAESCNTDRRECCDQEGFYSLRILLFCTLSIVYTCGEYQGLLVSVPSQHWQSSRNRLVACIEGSLPDASASVMRAQEEETLRPRQEQAQRLTSRNCATSNAYNLAKILDYDQPTNI